MSARWERLVETLRNRAGVETKIDTRRYPGGTSESITIKLGKGQGLIHIGDKWWRKNDSVWIGWGVTLEDAEGIAIRVFPLTKKRGEVADNVAAALATVNR